MLLGRDSTRAKCVRMTIAALAGRCRPDPPGDRCEIPVTPGPVDHVDSALWALFRRLSPRRTLRVDTNRAHDYRSAPFTALPPPEPVPYAVYLAGRDHRYRLLCLDLDASAGRDVVAEDLHRLCELLDTAGARYAVAASGSPGGQHVWAYVPAGLPASQVAELARGLAALLPSLDAGMLHNPVAGCARPPGAPHRNGGVSRFDPAWHPDPAAAVVALSTGNAPEVFERMFDLLPPGVRQSAAGSVKPARCHRLAPGAGAPRLAGERRALSPAVAALVASRPEDGDYSAHLWRLLLGAALARWSREEFAELLDHPDTVGLEHLRSRVQDGRRVPRSATQTAEVLARQWARAVTRAAGLPARAVPDGADQVTSRVAEVTAAVAAIHAAAEAVPWRWAGLGGPADRAALRAACRLALAACSLTVAIDVRRWSLLAGHAASTMALAARRLSRSDPINGPAWLALHTPAAGRLAAVWRLLPVAPELGLDSDQDGQSSPSVAIRAVDNARTQGHSPRPPFGPPASSPCSALAQHLSEQETHDAHDVWHPRAGLGHHVARTYAALQAGSRTIEELTTATAYTPDTIRRHLIRLERVGLAVTSRGGRRARPGRRSLDAVARQLGTAGAGATRRARYLIDRELYAWWNAELAWRRTPRALKPRVPRRPQSPGQRALVVTAAGPLTTYGRFPTRPNGRVDYPAAAATVRAHLDADSSGSRVA